jgi:hypothetical protein
MPGTSLLSASVSFGLVHQILLPRIQSKKFEKAMFFFCWIYYMSFAGGDNCSSRNHILHLETIFVMSFFICLLFFYAESDIHGNQWAYASISPCTSSVGFRIQTEVSVESLRTQQYTADPFCKLKWISYTYVLRGCPELLWTIWFVALNNITFSRLILLLIRVIWMLPKASDSKIWSWFPCDSTRNHCVGEDQKQFSSQNIYSTD